MYASVASLAFGVPYEACLEFHPETHEYQPEGKKRRSEAKVIVLGKVFGLSRNVICPVSRNMQIRLLIVNIVNYITPRCVPYILVA